MAIHPPDHDGGGLVNLMAEIELRFTGDAPMPGLRSLGLPDSNGYVLALFDGLGSHQLSDGLRRAFAGSLTAGFPTTTTTSLSTVATGMSASRHGVIGHILRLPGLDDPVNVLKWITPHGSPVAYDYAGVLPSPNLWERLRAAGIEPITVQPGPFAGSPLSQMLYRGCRWESVWTVGEVVDATVDLAGPGRLVFTYFADVDVAAHVSGQASETYRIALEEATKIWEELAIRLPDSVGLVGTSDHGHIDYRAPDKVMIRDPVYDPLRFAGDPRSVYAWGESGLIERLANEVGAASFAPSGFTSWLGPRPLHPELDARLPDRLLLAPPGRILLPRIFDKRLIGYHGGLEPAEVEVPLIIRGDFTQQSS